MKTITTGDNGVKEILKITEKSTITMTVHGITDTYKFSDEPSEDEGYELYSVTQQKVMYGLSCANVLEVIGILIQDYASGTLTDIKVENK